jgi:hypothetical protein
MLPFVEVARKEQDAIIIIKFLGFIAITTANFRI